MTLNCSVQFSVALRPQRPYGLLGTGSPGRPPGLSHSSQAVGLWMSDCSFTQHAWIATEVVYLQRWLVVTCLVTRETVAYPYTRPRHSPPVTNVDLLNFTCRVDSVSTPKGLCPLSSESWRRVITLTGFPALALLNKRPAQRIQRFRRRQDKRSTIWPLALWTNCLLVLVLALWTAFFTAGTCLFFFYCWYLLCELTAFLAAGTCPVN